MKGGITITFVIIAGILLVCIAADKISDRLRLPALVLFMLVGMFFGQDGPFHFEFEDYALTERICSAALIFIMFYGGFNLKWKYAKKIWPQAVSLSTAGVVLTTIFCAALLHWFTKMDWILAFLISSILGSTDAASVFAILRREHLNLKDHTASILEMESGSNDPVAYMLTFISIQMYLTGSAENIALQVICQLAFGLLIGWVSAKLTVWLFEKSTILSQELSALAMIAMVLLCYGLSSVLKGNAYLSVYIMGVLVGNSKIPWKSALIPFFDGVTSIAQVVIFFLLGLLSFPSQILPVLPLSLLIFGILLFVARPLAVFLIMLPFRASFRQCLLISFAGLRGAASSVFAVMAVASGVFLDQNLFQIVFVVTLLSVAIQGALLPAAARKLDMIDEKEDVGKTFNDYVASNNLSLLRVYVGNGHPWANKKIRDIRFARGSLALILEHDGTNLACKGDTLVQPGDTLILNIVPARTDEQEDLQEVEIERSHPWNQKAISQLDLPDNVLIAMIFREDRNIIPSGKTVIQTGDRVVLYSGAS